MIALKKLHLIKIASCLMALLPINAYAAQCEWVLKYGTRDLVINTEMYSSNYDFRRSVCSKYTSIKNSNDDAAFAGHYFAIGGQGRYSRQKYSNIAEWACNNSSTSIQTDELKKSFILKASPTVYDSLNKCLEHAANNWEFEVTRTPKDKQITVSLKDNKFFERNDVAKLKVTTIFADESKFDCKGPLLENVTDNQPATIDNNVISFYCTRILNNDDTPGAIIADDTAIILLTTKGALSIQFAAIANPQVIAGYMVQYSTTYLSKSGEVTLKPKNDRHLIYHPVGGAMVKRM